MVLPFQYVLSLPPPLSDDDANCVMSTFSLLSEHHHKSQEEVQKWCPPTSCGELVDKGDIDSSKPINCNGHRWSWQGPIINHQHLSRNLRRLILPLTHMHFQLFKEVVFSVVFSQKTRRMIPQSQKSSSPTESCFLHRARESFFLHQALLPQAPPP